MAVKYWISTSSTSFNTAANWSDTAAPANGDTLVFNALGTASVETNLSTVLTTITLVVEKSYTGRIGVLSGATATYLVLDGGTLIVGQNTGQGSPTGSTLVMVNFGSTAGTVYSYDSATTGYSTYYTPIIVKGTGVTLYQTGGSASLAPFPGETATLTLGSITEGSGGTSPSLYLGTGVTVTALSAASGSILSRSGQTATAVTLSGNAVYTAEGTGAHTTITADGESVVNYGGTGTIATLNLSGTFSNESYAQSFTVTDRNFYKGAKYLINNGRSASVTQTNAYSLKNCGLHEITVRTPPGKNL